MGTIPPPRPGGGRKMIYYYYIVDHDETIEDVRDIESRWCETDAVYIASDAAEKEYDNHDGWEWMEGGVDELVLLREDKSEIGRFSVKVEFDPEFYATEIKKETP